MYTVMCHKPNFPLTPRKVKSVNLFFSLWIIGDTDEKMLSPLARDFVPQSLDAFERKIGNEYVRSFYFENLDDALIFMEKSYRKCNVEAYADLWKEIKEQKTA